MQSQNSSSFNVNKPVRGGVTNFWKSAADEWVVRVDWVV